MPPTSLGWAVVSTGRHPDTKMAPAINAASGNHIASVVSRELDRAQEFAAKHDAANAYDDYSAMLRDPAVDIVYLASPNHLHAEQTVMAAAAGKHVLCEKPMALSMADGQRMVDACTAAGVHLGVGFHLRSHPAHQRLRQLVSDGTLGTVSLAQVSWVRGNRGQERPPARPTAQQWWEDPAMVGAGVMMATGVHCVDLLRYVLGEEVTELTALTDGAPGTLEHIATMLLRFESGTVATVTTSRRNPDWPSQDVAVHGSLGRGAVVGSVDMVLAGELTVETDLLSERETYDPPDAIGLYTRQVGAFAEAVVSGQPSLADGVDGLRLVEITLAMVESASTGRRVALGT